MAEVIHRYVGRGDKLPKVPPAEQKERAKARAADAELVRERAEAIRTRRMQSQLSLALARNELIPKSLAQSQASFVFAGLRAKILAIPQTYSRRLLGISDYEVMSRLLKAMSISILREIEDLPRAVEPGWRGNIEEEK